MAGSDSSSRPITPHSRPITPQGILETVTYCVDLGAAKGFYHDLLQLELVSEEPGRHLFFRVGSSMLLIFNPIQTRDSTVKVGGETIPRHGPEGPCHFAFQVDAAQLATIKQTLQTAGIAVESEIDWPGGGSSLYCRDPAGNSVEFATRDLWFRG